MVVGRGELCYTECGKTERKPKMRENIVRLVARGIFLHRCVQILAWRYKKQVAAQGERLRAAA